MKAISSISERSAIMPQSSYATRHKAKAAPLSKSDLRARENFQSAKALKKKEAKDEDRRQGIKMLDQLMRMFPY